MPDTPTLFADGLLEASVHFGVVRLTLAQAGSGEKPVPAGQLIVPLTQLPVLTNALLQVLQQVEAKAKEAQASRAAAHASQIAEAPATPGSFRFGS